MQDIDLKQYISVDPEICHGKPCIKGTRVLVKTVLVSLDEGMTAEDIHSYYPSISYETIEALAHYAKEQRQKQPGRRLGFLSGEISVPKDFDDMAADEIKALFETGDWES